MKAYEIRTFGIDELAIVEIEEPVPAAGEVVVRVAAASLNYRDVMVVNGVYNPRMKLPATPLSDAAGEVVEIGENVTRWKVGDRVMPIFAQRWFAGKADDAKRRTAIGAGSQWQGVLREYASFDERGLVRVPDHLSFAEAATLPCSAVTAWNALLVSGHLRPGQIVLTLGSGGVSTFAIQLAKLAGAKVIATTGSNEKAERLRSIGADMTINYREIDDWDREVLELTDRQGVDHVVEVGGAGTLARSVNAVKVGGHIAMIGALSGGTGIDPIPLFMKAVRLQGIFVGSREMLEELCKAVAASALHPVVDRTFAFGEAREALRYMESGSHFGKIVIDLTA
jgi:NADPH:quinone reductase-like Zn-dependent oxidoreductase